MFTQERAKITVAADRLDKFLLDHIKVQLNCLRFRAGVPFGKLPRLSTGGNPYNLEHVESQYCVMLRKFDTNLFKPKPVVKSVEDRMMKQIDAFRAGTLTETAKMMFQQRREEILAEIERAKTERQEDLDRSRVRQVNRRETRRRRGGRGRRGGRRRRGGRECEGQRKFDNMEGKRVRVPSTYFGLSDGDIYGGVVGKWVKYLGGDFNEYWGYNILYDLGDEYCMIESDVKSYLAPDMIGVVELERNKVVSVSQNDSSSDSSSSDSGSCENWTIAEVLSEKFHIE